MLFYQVKVNWFSLSSLSVADAGGADEVGVNPALVPERSLYERCQEQLLEVLSALRSSHFSFTCVVRFTFYKLGNRTPLLNSTADAFQRCIFLPSLSFSSASSRRAAYVLGGDLQPARCFRAVSVPRHKQHRSLSLSLSFFTSPLLLIPSVTTNRDWIYTGTMRRARPPSSW